MGEETGEETGDPEGELDADEIPSSFLGKVISAECTTNVTINIDHLVLTSDICFLGPKRADREADLPREP